MILTKHEETKKGRLFHKKEKLRIFVSSCSINYLYQVIFYFLSSLDVRKSVKSLVVCGEFPTFAQEKRYLTTMEGIFTDPAIGLEGRIAIESSYKKGLAEGKAELTAKVNERTLEIARKMKAQGLATEIIATTTGLTADETNKLS